MPENKQIVNVMLKMSREELLEYSQTAPEKGGPPKGLNIIWYARSSKDSPYVNATLYWDKNDVENGIERSISEIHEEIAKLGNRVKGDHITKSEEPNLDTDPLFKVEAPLESPIFDNDGGRFDFLRSKPVHTHHIWVPKNQMQELNTALAKNLGNNATKKILKTDGLETITTSLGFKMFKLTMAQIIGKDKLRPGERGAADPVPPHIQESQVGRNKVSRRYEGKITDYSEEVRITAENSLDAESVQRDRRPRPRETRKG